MLFNGVESVFNLRDVVYVMEDDAVGVDDVVDSSRSAYRDSGDAVPQEDKFGRGEWCMSQSEICFRTCGGWCHCR